MTTATSKVSLRTGERFARRVVTGCAVLVVAACFGFSFGNVLALGRQLAVPPYVAWLIAPAVDLTVVGLIVGVRHLSLRGIEGRRLRPARLLLVAAGLATWALNTAHALFVRRHLGAAAYDSLAPLLLICWAEVGPWFLRQFRAAATANLSVSSGRRTEAPTGPAANHQPAHGSAARVRPTGDVRPPERAATALAERQAADRQPARATAGEQDLLDRARALNAAHWQAYGRQISRDKLRAALGIGATRAERLLGVLAAERPPISPPASGPTPAAAPVALAARPHHWAILPAQPVGGDPPMDGDHG
jgi:hypothetical protein